MSLAGFSAASINFGLNVAAVGTAFPLQVDADKVNNPGSTPIYSAGVWSFKNSTAVTSVTITDAGNVGVGTASPGNYGTANTKQITVLSGDQNITLGAYWQSGVGQYGIINAGTTNNGGATALVFQTGGTERMRIDASGRLLVGLTSATFGSGAGVCISNSVIALQLRNPATAAGKGWNVGPGSTNEFVVYNQNGTGVYAVDGGTGWLANSDKRLKKNIKPLELGLEQIKALKPARFDYNQDESESSARVGFIAQEVLPVLPHAVHAPEDSEKMMGVSATEMIPVLVKAIQELEARLAALESK